MAKAKETKELKGESCECDSGCGCDDSGCYSSCGMHFCAKCGVAMLVFGAIFLVAGLGLYSAPWFNTNTIVGVFLALAGLLAITGMGKM